MKKVLSIVLCVVMLFALTVPAFAASGKNYYDYENYLCLGDSIAVGYGLSRDGKPTKCDQTPEDLATSSDNKYIFRGYDFSVAQNAYHSLVANELGANLLMCARSGIRAVELRYMLDGVFNDYDPNLVWDNTYFDTDGNDFGLDDLDTLNAQIGYPEKVKQADLITINVGSNDVFSLTMVEVMAELTKDSSNPTLNAVKDYLEKTGNIGAAFGKLIDAYQSMGKIADLAQALTTTLNKTYKQFTVNYSAVIDKIYEINPDVTVVALGVYNPFADLHLSADSPLDLSGITAPVVTSINTHINSLKLTYSNYYYADIVGTPTYPMNYDDQYFWEYFNLKMHPTIEGHKFIAEKILEALPTAPLTAPTVTAGNNEQTGKITLNWTAVKGAASYDVYRSLTKYGPFVKMTSTDGTGCTDSSAKVGYTYYYKVRAVAADGTKSDYSTVVSRTCNLAAPVVTPGNNPNTGRITLTWDKVSGAEEYVVYRANYLNGTYTKMFTTSGTSYTNTSCVAGYTYFYKVKAVLSTTSDAGSSYSAVVSRTADCAAPVVKIGLDSYGRPHLTWGSVKGAGSYDIYRATSPDGPFTKQGSVKGTSVTNVYIDHGTTYYYKVMAVSARTVYANSAFSPVVSITAK